MNDIGIIIIKEQKMKKSLCFGVSLAIKYILNNFKKNEKINLRKPFQKI